MIIDSIGLAGVASVMLGYFLLVRGKLLSTSLTYLLLNMGGSFGILFSLCFNFNLAAFVTQVIFICISIYGIFKNVWHFRKL